MKTLFFCKYFNLLNTLQNINFNFFLYGVGFYLKKANFQAGAGEAGFAAAGGPLFPAKVRF